MATESLIAFKYRPVDDYLVESIRDNYIYFSSPNELNDPFDCRIDIHSAIRAALSLSEGQKAETLAAISTGRTLFDAIQDLMNKSGVFSLTSTVEHSVMWSLYADKHRGVCLAYDIPDEFVLDTTTNIVGRAPVTYGDEPITEWLIENAETVDFDDPRDFALELMKKVLTAKASDWSYENEYRLISKEAGPLSIPTEFLTQVCFGLKTTDKDIERVVEALSLSKSKALKVKIMKSDTNFGLKAVEI